MEEYVTNAVFKEYSYRIDAENEMQNKRIGELESTVKQIQGLTIAVEKMAVSIDSMAKEISNQGKKLEQIESKPAQKWDKFSWIIISALTTGIFGYIIGMVLR